MLVAFLEQNFRMDIPTSQTSHTGLNFFYRLLLEDGASTFFVYHRSFHRYCDDSACFKAFTDLNTIVKSTNDTRRYLRPTIISYVECC
ncbi:uncharacterized protein PHALS_14614 [Plasmopara halstedii]|uniref:Uncharacterized protein n=1 Tax=Plasmopara halstedii TaxID=4781 RepID=A0A0P1AMC6_PLAHL|nr:uncharacterized protein PHALS_14614 [Plasmopara halstedii]CEG42292.1 hypothetical protein PHALS_14614 [Plasmopara halstedii]|eukprot:XP_024578661.1 hypothetical protein PHALS_14614 [Plasmopara halstedii]